jgi:hypothetical protein
MAKIIDNKAMLLDVFTGESKKSGKPFRIAKILFSGTGSVSSAFLSDKSPSLPPLHTWFACELSIAVDANGGISAVINEHAKFGKSAE